MRRQRKTTLPDEVVLLIGGTIVSLICFFSCMLYRYYNADEPIPRKKYTVQVTYNNGSTETIKFTKRINSSYSGTLHNGCLYLTTREAPTMWSDTEYSNSMRCGVRKFKTLKIEKIWITQKD